MPEDRNKIATSLTLEELDAFVEALAAKPGKERTLEAIRALAAEHGITISLMSAKSFRDTTFGRHLERLRRRNEKSQRIAAMVGDGSGRTLNEASLGIMAEKIFDELNADDDATGDDEEPARLDLEKVDTLTKAAARIQKGFGEVDRVKTLLAESQAKLREFERKEAEREEKVKAAEKDLAKLRDATGGISDAERAAIVATVDDILGIKKKA
jgi:hypothetical protein